MYAYLKGTLEEITEDAIVVEAGNIGYNVKVSATTVELMPGIGSEVKIYTYTLVREDTFSLYGFLTRDDLEIFKKLITEYQIPAELLNLELTESAFMEDQDLIMKTMSNLHKLGFKIMMDDFGSGYSSLNILLETPFDVIKLDRKFMENMMVSDKGKLILEQVVSMSDKLELGLLAEGVESKAQIDLLQSIGCDQVQGYYYAKPMPEDEFFALLKENAL